MDNNLPNNETNNSTVEIKVLLSDIWRGFVKFGWIAVVLAVVLGGIQFYRSYVRFSPEYKASATFTVHTENKVISGENGVSAYSFYYNRDTANQLAGVFPNIVGSPILQNRVCEELKLARMPATVEASCVEGTNMITLTATGSDAKLTYETLLSVIKNYSAVGDYIIGRTKLVMISEPVMPQKPSNSLVWRSSVMKGIIIGFVLGAAWIILYAILRKTVKTKEDVKNILNRECVGVLPQVLFKKYRRKINTDVVLTNPMVGKDFLEALRLLRGSVQRALNEGEKTVMITSTAPGEGKTVLSVNLASMFAKAGKKVLVVDCDLRNTGIMQLLGDKLSDESVVYKNDRFTINGVDEFGFDFLNFTDGAKNIRSIIRTAGLKKLFSQLKEDYDLILIDTPPCGIISDATIVAGAAEAILYVVRQDAVMQNAIRAGINAMLETDARFLGCVLNGAMGGLGGYGSYYNYGGYYKYYRYGHSYGYGGRKNKRQS